MITEREKVLGAMGTIIALAMFVSLIEVALNNIRKGAKIWIQPAITILNCAVWSSYALFRGDWFLLTANAPGVLIAVFTVYAAFQYAPQPQAGSH